MYTKRGFDDKYEQWKEAFEDFMRTNEQIKYARERVKSQRASYGNTSFGTGYYGYDPLEYLNRRERENIDQLRDWKPKNPWDIPLWDNGPLWNSGPFWGNGPL